MKTIKFIKYTSSEKKYLNDDVILAESFYYVNYGSLITAMIQVKTFKKYKF